jgi:hypothetical protein
LDLVIERLQAVNVTMPFSLLMLKNI